MPQKASTKEKQSTAWSKAFKWFKEVIGVSFYLYSVSSLPVIHDRITSLFSVGKLSCYIRKSQPEGWQRFASPTEHDLHHTWTCTHMGHWRQAAAVIVVSWEAHTTVASAIDPLPPSPCCIPTAAEVSCSPFSQPPLPAPYFSGSKRGGLQWRAPCNLCLTISIWQLLWFPAARWKGQKPWLCWAGVPRDRYVNKAQLCSFLHLTLFSHSCLDLRWN